MDSTGGGTGIKQCNNGGHYRGKVLEYNNVTTVDSTGESTVIQRCNKGGQNWGSTGIQQFINGVQCRERYRIITMLQPWEVLEYSNITTVDSTGGGTGIQQCYKGGQYRGRYWNTTI